MPFAQYLDRYAEFHIRQLEGFPGSYKCACVIPCFAEDSDFLLQNAQVFNSVACLLIVVINQPPAAQANTANLALQRFIQDSYRCLWRSGDQALTLFASGEQSCLLCVDSYTEGRELPAQQGVGLARKIGADIACQLFHTGKIANPWIFTTDADVILPADYFNAASNVGQAAAIILPYLHRRPPDRQQALAIELYQASLRYYASGLRWAGSPYAFETVGSTLAIHAEHYAKVRGFPRRSAGEDFYILNKLRKTGAVVSLNAPIVSLAARQSQRTPFGTGAALEKILQLEDLRRDFLFYNPAVFKLLQDFLTSLPAIWKQHDASSNQHRYVRTLLANAIVDERLLKLLHKQDVDAGLYHAITHSKTLDGFLKHTCDWFDAFRTLKLIHSLRDNYFPSVNQAALQTLAPEFFQIEL